MAAKANAKARIQHQQAAQYLARLGIPVEEDPRIVMLKQVYAANGMAIAMQIAVQELTTQDLTNPSEETILKLRMYSEWTERASRLAKAATEIGLEERMVHLAESQGKAVVSVVRAIVHGMNLTPMQAAAAFRIAAEQLRELAPQFTLVEGSALDIQRDMKQPVSAGLINVTPPPALKAGLE